MDIKIVYVEAALMPNNELIHMGQTLGYINEKQRKLVDSGANKLTRGNEVVVAIRPNVA